MMRISPGKWMRAYYERIRAAFALRRLQVFGDRGSDFSEADSDVYPMAGSGCDLCIAVPGDVRRLRLDPGEAAGGLILKATFENGKEAVFSSNGFLSGEQTDIIWRWRSAVCSLKICRKMQENFT